MLHSYIPFFSQMAISNRLPHIKFLYVLIFSPNPTTFQTYHGWFGFTIQTLLVTGIQNKAPNYAKLVTLSFLGPNILFSMSFSQTLSQSLASSTSLIPATQFHLSPPVQLLMYFSSFRYVSIFKNITRNLRINI